MGKGVKDESVINARFSELRLQVFWDCMIVIFTAAIIFCLVKSVAKSESS